MRMILSMLAAAALAGCSTVSAMWTPEVATVTWVFAKNGTRSSPYPQWVRRLNDRESCIVEHLPGDGNSNLTILGSGTTPRLSVHVRSANPDDQAAARAFARECGIPPRTA